MAFYDVTVMNIYCALGWHCFCCPKVGVKGRWKKPVHPIMLAGWAACCPSFMQRLRPDFKAPRVRVHSPQSGKCADGGISRAYTRSQCARGWAVVHPLSQHFTRIMNGSVAKSTTRDEADYSLAREKSSWPWWGAEGAVRHCSKWKNTCVPLALHWKQIAVAGSTTISCWTPYLAYAIPVYNTISSTLPYSVRISVKAGKSYSQSKD